MYLSVGWDGYCVLFGSESTIELQLIEKVLLYGPSRDLGHKKLTDHLNLVFLSSSETYARHTVTKLFLVYQRLCDGFIAIISSSVTLDKSFIVCSFPF